MSSRSISGELSKKIMLTIAILVLGGILGIILFSGRVVKESASKNAESSLNTYVKAIDALLAEVETMESFVSWQLGEHIDNADYLETVNEKLMQYSIMVSGVTIAFKKNFYTNKGEYFALRTVRDSKSGGITHKTLDKYADEPWFQRASTEGSKEWSEPYLTADAGQITTYSTPLKDSKGNIFAVLSVDLSLDGLNSRLSREHFYEGAYAVIMSKEGNILIHPDKDLVLKNVIDLARSKNDKHFEDFAMKMKAGESGIGLMNSGQVASIYGPVRNGWSAALICPSKSIFGGALRFQLLILLIALVDLLVIYLVTRTVINRTLLPITEVTYLAKNVAKGNFKAEIPQVEGSNEMFHLHEALRNMLRSINDYISQLKTTTAANERFESELAIASDIQQQMLRTDFINDEEVDLYAALKPAKEVGGDMYDFLRTGRTIYFAVGDVSGKGVPAALYMAISRSLFHYVSEQSQSANSIVSCINNSFCSGNENNMFITMFVGRLDLDTRELVFCNAGHNPIVVISPDGKARYVKAKSNLAAGVFDQFPYEKESMIVEKGSRLLIYTDGVTEAEDAFKNQYGEDRLLEYANTQSTDTPSEEFVERLIENVKTFTKGNGQNDDITILSVRV